MGCFLGCFGVPKDRSRSKPIKGIPSRDHRFPEHYKLLQQNSLPRPQPLLSPSPPSPQRNSPLKLQLLAGEEDRPGSHTEPRDTNEERVAAPNQFPEEKPMPQIPESGGRSEKQNSSSSPRKRVTFDLNVKTYEREPQHDESEDVAEEKEHSDEEKSQRVGISTPAGSSEAFPSNHRYQNCTIGDGEDSEGDGDDEFSDDYDEQDSDGEDCDDDDGDGVDAIRGIKEEDESFESYFSPRTGKNKQSCKEQPTESGHGARDRSRYVRSVLNPVENLSQWKEAKAKAQPLNSTLAKKENICLGRKDEVLVEASLANWLPPSEIKGCRMESKVTYSDHVGCF